MTHKNKSYGQRWRHSLTWEALATPKFKIYIYIYIYISIYRYQVLILAIIDSFKSNAITTNFFTTFL